MVNEYAALLETYQRMFDMVDAFHFNSQNTAEVYRRYIDIPASSKVIPITHSGIKDRRKVRCYDERLLRLGFIGSEAPYKGLPMLKDVINQLNKEGYSEKIALHVYGGRTGCDKKLPNVIYKGRFTSAMMEQVFDDMDLLVVPSICYETFSLVTLEAFSSGVPVIVSDKVGAKDIVTRYCPKFIYKSITELYELFLELIKDKHLLVESNKNIILDDSNYCIKEHAKEIINFYKYIITR